MPGSGSGMNNPDHISEILETIFGVKSFEFFDTNPGSGMEKILIRDKHPGSTTLKNIVLSLRVSVAFVCRGAVRRWPEHTARSGVPVSAYLQQGL
jgi:hypothetical protein